MAEPVGRSDKPRSEGFPRASVLEGIRFTAQVGAPNIILGLFNKREVPTRIASTLGADYLGYRLVEGMVRSHGPGPFYVRVARDEALVDLVNQKIRYVLLSGAHLDLDTLDVLREILPHTAISMAYGSTMILSQARTRIGTDCESWIFEPRTPYVVFWVVDPVSGVEVPYGERGQVVMNHISKGMLIPNNLERDTAIRHPGPFEQVGDSVSEVAPVGTFDGEPVIEGVY